jgi:hypothetical protein
MFENHFELRDRRKESLRSAFTLFHRIAGVRLVWRDEAASIEARTIPSSDFAPPRFKFVGPLLEGSNDPLHGSSRLRNNTESGAPSCEDCNVNCFGRDSCSALA